MKIISDIFVFVRRNLVVPILFRNGALLGGGFLFSSIFLSLPVLAQANMQGSVTGLPLPRFVSLKSDRVNLREGPSKDNRTSWVFQRAGLPVEITAEFETWRRIRDSEGAEGWVLHSLLSGRRTALIAPVKKDDKTSTQILYERADERSGVVARLQPGVLASIKQCDGVWCRILGSAGTFDGYIRQERVWGAYPNERID